MSGYRSIFFEPDWVQSRYYGWSETHADENLRILSKPGAIRRHLILSDIDRREGAALLPVMLGPLRSLSSEIVLHDFSASQAAATALADRGFRPLPDSLRLLNIATFVIDLSRTDDELMSRMTPDCRRRIRKAIADGIEITGDASPSDAKIEAFLDAFAQMARERGLRMPSRSILRRMFADRRAMLFSTVSAGDATNYVMTYQAGDKAIWLHGAGRGRSTDAGQLLHWRVMQALREAGIRWYDMGGVVLDESNGIHRFKKGFGGDLVKLGGEYVARSPFARLMRQAARVRRLGGRAR